MKHISDLNEAVIGLSVDETFIDCLCGEKLIKIEKSSGRIVLEKTVFEKKGFSRGLIADEDAVYIYDFCILYAFSRRSFELIGKWKLGNDLSSDICGIAADKDTVFCSIRNGRIITVDRRSESVKEYLVSDNSMWSIQVYHNRLVCGTVDGRLLILDKNTLSAEISANLSNKNIGSIHIDGRTIYAASHDGRLLKINMESMEIETTVRKAHRKMFKCIGIYKDMLLTVSYPCSEIIMWNKNTLEKVNVINYPLKLSGCAYIENNLLYITSRNISGIAVIDLSKQTVLECSSNNPVETAP